MTNYSTENQITYIIQWFRTWSDFQKDDFVHILAQKISPGQFINGIVNGMQNMDTSGRPPSLFSCQVKLFKEWWDTWNESDREKLIAKVKESDAKFWTEVESELSGTRAKLEDDFFSVTLAAIAPIAAAEEDVDQVIEDDADQAIDDEVVTDIGEKQQLNGIEKVEVNTVDVEAEASI